MTWSKLKQEMEGMSQNVECRVGMVTVSKASSGTSSPRSVGESPLATRLNQTLQPGIGQKPHWKCTHRWGQIYSRGLQYGKHSGDVAEERFEFDQFWANMLHPNRIFLPDELLQASLRRLWKDEPRLFLELTIIQITWIKERKLY